MILQVVLPVAIGEFGSKFEDNLDAQTMHDLAAYMGEHNLQVAFQLSNTQQSLVVSSCCHDGVPTHQGPAPAAQL